MKILALCDYQMDYLAEGILVGLWETGHEIYEMPVLKHVRGEVDEGYPLPDGSRGMTGPPGHLLPNVLPTQLHNDPDEIIELALRNTFDLVILLSHREHAILALRQLFDHGIQIGRLPLVSCDGEDAPYLNTTLLSELGVRVHFKRELLRGQTRGEYDITHYVKHDIPIWPLPFSAFTRNYPTDLDDTQKDLDFFLKLGWTWPARDKLLAACLEYCVENNLSHHIGINGQSSITAESSRHKYFDHLEQDWFGWQEYMTRQAHAHMTAVIRGWGRDSLHVWEAFSFATATLYCDPQIYIPFPFRDEEHCLYIKEDASDVKAQLGRFHHDPELRSTLAQAGKARLYAHHTNERRAAYLINVAFDTLYADSPSPEEFQLL